MLHRIWNYILNLDIDPNTDKIERLNAQRLNLFSFFIGIVLIFIGFKDLIFGLTIYSWFLGVLGLFFLFLFFFTKARRSVIAWVIIIEFAMLLVFFFSSISGFENGLSFYYFLLIIISPFVFYSRKTLKYIFCVFVTGLVLFLISHYNGFKMFSIDEGTLKFPENQRLITFIVVLTCFAVVGYYILLNHFTVLELYQKVLRGEKIINNLRAKLNRKDDMDLENLVKLAMNDDIAFIPKIKSSFPELYDNLQQINPEITSEEFKLCALLKLGFTTKDIAEYNHIAVRTVQTRKSRLRKSFAVPAETDLYKWIDTL